MPQVFVTYKETRAGRIALQYASDANARFSDQPLVVLVEGDRLAADKLNSSMPDVQDTVIRRVHSQVSVLVVAGTSFEVRLCDSSSAFVPPVGSIFVDADAQKKAAFHCIHPSNETSVQGRRDGPVLITFSDGETGLVSAQAAFDLIAALDPPADGPQVIFYHTTWPDPDAPSPEPLDHMCEAAERVMLALEAAATERGLRFETIIETHDDVAQGVIETAFRRGVVLIAMDRSEQVSHGSYVDRILEQSPIPVFVAAPGTPVISEPASFERLTQFYRGRRDALATAGNKVKVWHRTLTERLPLFNPLFVMGLVALMYIVKMVSKESIGRWVGSPTLSADGIHNGADFLQALMVIIVIMVAMRPVSQRYPWGRKNLESVTQLIIGGLLFITAAKFCLDCAIGFVHLFWHDGYLALMNAAPWLPAAEDGNLTWQSFPWVMAVGFGSVIASLLVSRYQIFVGKRTGHVSMVADGEETRSDGWIEIVTVIGMVAQFFLEWRFIEYGLGLVVAVMICGTAKELWLMGWRVMLQHSLGSDVEQELDKTMRCVAGVDTISEMKTFQIGHTAIVLATVQSMARSAALPYVKKALEDAVRACVLSDACGFKAADVHIKVDRIDANRSRIGFALGVDAAGKLAYVAPSLLVATHLAVCDIERGEIVRTKVLPLAGKDVAALLLEKRLHRLCVLNPEDAHTEELIVQARARAARTAKAHLLPDTQVIGAATYTLPPLGVFIHDQSSNLVAQAI